MKLNRRMFVRQLLFCGRPEKFFPEDSIFVNVVDPGVGSDRRVICRKDRWSALSSAPKNGLLDYVVAEAKETEFYEVTNRDFFLPTISSTFHGRDVFAPVAVPVYHEVRG